MVLWWLIQYTSGPVLTVISSSPRGPKIIHIRAWFGPQALSLTYVPYSKCIDLICNASAVIPKPSSGPQVKLFGWVDYVELVILKVDLNSKKCGQPCCTAFYILQCVLDQVFALPFCKERVMFVFCACYYIAAWLMSPSRTLETEKNRLI